MTRNHNRRTERKAAKLKWWHLALITAAVSFLGAVSGGSLSDKGQRKFYKELNQAPWAPPGWMFGPAWMFINFFLLLGLKRIIVSRRIRDKRKYLSVQGAIWFIFFTFNYIYFRRKSPVLAALWTKADFILAVTGLLVTLKVDRKAACTYVPLLLWTGFAGTVAAYQALYNPDPCLNTPALLTN